MVGIQRYMTQKDDIQIQALLKHQRSKALISAPKETAIYLSKTVATGDLSKQHPMTSIQKARQQKQKCNRDEKKLMKEI